MKKLSTEHSEVMRALGHKMIDDLFGYLKENADGPVWRKIPDSTKAKFKMDIPLEGATGESVYQDFLKHILPYNTNNVHPRFWSWVQGSGSEAGMLADLLASGMNSNVSIGEHMPMYVEHQVLNWCKQMMGFPSNSSGLLVSGASIANITALIVARNHINKSAKAKGLLGNPQLVVYGSAETHNCVSKGIEVVGIGSEYFRKIAVKDDFTVDVIALQQQIKSDRLSGLQPMCIIGNAGTVNTGAIDDLSTLSTIAKQEGLWFHVDGAFGAIPKILPEFENKLKAIEEADSVSFDFHKWMYVNYEVACVLIKDAAAHRAAFASPVHYLTSHERGLSGGPDPFSNYGMELSRGFKALKVWMSLKIYGLDHYREMVRENLKQAHYLEKIIEETPFLQLMAPVSLNIVCFRFNIDGLNDEVLNQLNKNILMQLQEEGIAAPSYTLIKNCYVIRVAITNHRTTMNDLQVLIENTIRIGKSLQ